MGFQEKEAKKEHSGRKRETSDITNVTTKPKLGRGLWVSQGVPYTGGQRCEAPEEDAGREEEGPRLGGCAGPVCRAGGGGGVAREERRGSWSRGKLPNKRTKGQGSQRPLRAPDSGSEPSVRHNFVTFPNSWDKTGSRALPAGKRPPPRSRGEAQELG